MCSLTLAKCSQDMSRCTVEPSSTCPGGCKAGPLQARAVSKPVPTLTGHPETRPRAHKQLQERPPPTRGGGGTRACTHIQVRSRT